MQSISVVSSLIALLGYLADLDSKVQEESKEKLFFFFFNLQSHIPKTILLNLQIERKHVLLNKGTVPSLPNQFRVSCLGCDWSEAPQSSVPAEL